MLATGDADFCWCALWWWVCGLCDFCSFVFCVVHSGRIVMMALFSVVVVCGWLCVRY